MGSSVTKQASPFEIFPSLLPYEETCRALGLSNSEVMRFYKAFKDIDLHNNERVSVKELSAFLQVKYTNFARRVFGLIDVDGTDSLNFEEFVVGLWNYGTMKNDMFEHLPFDLYDSDHDGAIEVAEAQLMIKDIYGDDFSHDTRAKIVHQKLEEYDEGYFINYPEFSSFVKRYNAALYPAYGLQLSIKNKTMGKMFWMQQASRRLSMGNGEYLSIDQILSRKGISKSKPVRRTIDLYSDQQERHLDGDRCGCTNDIRRGSYSSGTSSEVSGGPDVRRFSHPVIAKDFLRISESKRDHSRNGGRIAPARTCADGGTICKEKALSIFLSSINKKGQKKSSVAPCSD